MDPKKVNNTRWAHIQKLLVQMGNLLGLSSNGLWLCGLCTQLSFIHSNLWCFCLFLLLFWFAAVWAAFLFLSCWASLLGWSAGLFFDHSVGLRPRSTSGSLGSFCVVPYGQTFEPSPTPYPPISPRPKKKKKVHKQNLNYLHFLCK